MTAMGQSRQFGQVPATSGLTRTTDIAEPALHVSSVPNSEVAQLTLPKKKPPEGGTQFKPNFCGSTRATVT
jgi:hypothetical protein